MKANFMMLKSIAVIATAGYASAATVYQIDIDSTDPSGPLATETGWTSFDGTLGNGSPTLLLYQGPESTESPRVLESASH